MIAPAVAIIAGLGFTKLVGGLIALVLLIPLSRRPAWCLYIAVPFVTLQQVGLPLLWSFGMPGQVARQLGGLKDLLVIALVVAAVQAIRTSSRKLDGIDKLALGYLAIVLVNLFAPQLFHPLIPASFSTRLLAFRYDAGYVLLFLGLRHAELPSDTRDRYVKVVLGLGAVVVAGAFWQKLANTSFVNFMFNTAHVTQFEVSVMHIPQYLATQDYAYFTAKPLQVGSFLVLPHYMADLLLVPLAFILERAARAQQWRRAVVVLLLIVTTLAMSQIRADLLAAIALVALVTIPRRGRTASARVGLVVLILAVAVVALPLLAGSRVTGGGNAATSNQAHHGEFGLAVNLMTHHPLGIGLGNNPATADRFQLSAGQQGALTGDNSWLQVGDELGVPAFLVYTAFIVAIFVELFRRGRDDPFPNAALLAFTGIWIAGMFHHVFLSFPQAWALWGAVGLALPAVRRNATASTPQPGEAALVQANSFA